MLGKNLLPHGLKSRKQVINLKRSIQHNTFKVFLSFNENIHKQSESCLNLCSANCFSIIIIIIIIIIKYLYSANILKVQKRFTEVTLKILKTLLKNTIKKKKKKEKGLKS